MSVSLRYLLPVLIILAMGFGGGCLCWLTGDCVEKIKPPSNPTPIDGSADVPVSVVLSWKGGDPVNGSPVRHDLYLSASNPPLLYRPSVSGRSVTLDSLALARTYFWQIVLIDAEGQSLPGPVWAFTTAYPPKFLAVTFPNWATSWSVGESRNVVWSSAYAGSSVKIELFKLGQNLCSIAEATPNNGSFRWELHGCASQDDPDYRIKVTSIQDETLYDYSDFFTVKTSCPIEITIPRQRDHWVANELRPIRWQPLGLSTGVKVSLSLYKGADFRDVIAPVTADDGEFDWVVGGFGDESDSDYRVRITLQGQLGCSQFSEFFTIQACSVRVESPTTNEIWPLGTQHTITWDTTYLPETLELELYHAGEFVCMLDDHVPNTGAYLWTVTRCNSLYGERFQVKLNSRTDNICGFSGRFDLH